MKKVLIYCGIAIGICAFVFMALVVSMMLFPGMEVFGVKYVSAKVGNYSYDLNKSFSGTNIHLKTGNVPVEISFGATGTVGIEFVQEFQGFTKADCFPQVDVLNEDNQAYIDSDSDVYINVNEYQKVIWANSMKKYYFKLNLPISYYNSGKIYIDTNGSNIKLTGKNQALDVLSIKTGAGISFENSLTVKNLSIGCSNSLTLGSNVKVTGDLVADIKNENLTVVNSVTGNIKFTTQGGDLNFVACKDLSITSQSGSVTGSDSAVITGNVNATFDSGILALGNVKGTVNVVSHVGNVSLKTCDDSVNITTTRGSVNIASAKTAEIVTTSGGINLAKCLNDVKLTSVSGDIKCGAVGGNAIVNNKSGDVSFTNSIAGDLNYNCNNGDLYLMSCNNLVVKSTNTSIKPYIENQNVIVNGKADINIASGNIVIYSINSEANVINLSSGSIKVSYIYGAIDCTSVNTEIVVSNCVSANIVNPSGSVLVGKAPDGVNVTCRTGEINLGKNGDIGNLVINSGSNKIIMKNTIGTINITDSGSDINLENSGCKNLIIKSTGSGNIVATGLLAKVEIESKGNIDIAFEAITENVKIKTSGASSSVKITASTTDLNSVNYDLRTNANNLCYIYTGEELYGEAKSTLKSAVTEGLYHIIAYCDGATVKLYMAGNVV